MKNSFVLGIMLSTIVTLFGYVLTYVLKFSDLISFKGYMQLLRTEKTSSASLLSLCLLANIPLIYYLNRRRMGRTLYGAFLVISVVAIYIVGVKFYLF